MKWLLLWIALQIPKFYSLAFDFTDATLDRPDALAPNDPWFYVGWMSLTGGAILLARHLLKMDPGDIACSECHKVKPATEHCAMIPGEPQLCVACYRARIWPGGKLPKLAAVVACCLAVASQAVAWEFVDSRGSNVTTRGRDVLIVIGQDFCVPLQRMAPELAGLKRDYPVEVIVLLPCISPGAAAWAAAVPGASNLCVCDVEWSAVVLDLWSAVGYAQPAAFLFDRNGFVKSNWMHYQTRTALEPAVARATIRLRSVPYGVSWPASPLVPRLESSGDLATWFPVPSSLITQAAGDNRAFYGNASRQFYRLAW